MITQKIRELLTKTTEISKPTSKQIYFILQTFIIIGLALGLTLLPFKKFAQAAITLDLSTTTNFQNTSSVAWTHTVGGSDRLLIVGVSYYNAGGSRSISSLTYGGVPLTKLTGLLQINVSAELWYLIAPALGSNTISVTIAGGNAGGVAGATSWTGINQITPFGTPVSIGGNNTNPSVAIGSAPGEVVQDILAWNRDVPTPPSATIGANQTQLWLGSSTAGGASSQEAGAASVTMSWNLSGPVNWALVAVPIKPAVPDTTPPVLSNGAPTGVLPAGTTSTTLSLNTNENASCRYSNIPNVNFTSMTDNFSNTGGTSHSNIISGLSDGNSYTFYVRCQDAAGNANTDDFAITFSVAPPDTTPPVISAIQANSISATGATITWTTDEPSDTQVEYGTTTAYGSQTPINPLLTTSHSQDLTSLNAGTLYHYRVKSRDLSGNLATSDDVTFTTTARPNILLFITDNQDERSMGEVMTKVQQHLVQLGTKFTNAHVPHPLCCPSRSSILTGQYNHNNGVLSNFPPTGGISKLNQSQTLPVWLQNSGYHTGLIGKYLNDYGLTDTDPGNGLPACKEVPPGWSEWYGIVDNKSQPNNYALNENGNIVIYGSRTLPSGCNPTLVSTVYETDLFSQKTVDFINRRATSTEPFFLYVSFDAPEMAVPAARHANIYSTRPLPQPPSFNEANVTDKPQFVKNTPLLSSSQISTITARYRNRLGALLAVDEAVEAAVNALTANGQIDNTIIIFMSDQGEMLGEHRLSGVLYGYEESNKIPLVIRGPNITASATNASLVANIDLAPTILEFAQTSPGIVMDGQSFVPLLNNPSYPWRTSLLLDARGSSTLGQNYKGVRTTQYMYNEYPNGNKELYNMTTDPYQLTSQHNNPAYSAIMQSLQQTLNRLKVCSGPTCWQ